MDRGTAGIHVAIVVFLDTSVAVKTDLPEGHWLPEVVSLVEFPNATLVGHDGVWRLRVYAAKPTSQCFWIVSHVFAGPLNAQARLGCEFVIHAFMHYDVIPFHFHFISNLLVHCSFMRWRQSGLQQIHGLGTARVC